MCLELCLDYMVMSLASENIVEYLTIADTFKESNLKEVTMHYLKENISYCIDSSSWEDLVKDNPSLLLEVLRNNVHTKEKSQPINGTISVSSSVKEIYGSRLGLEGLAEDMEKLKEDEKFTDIELVCEEVTLKHHKLVLAARSPVFRAMFLNKFKEGTSGIVMIEDVKLDVLKVHFF